MRFLMMLIGVLGLVVCAGGFATARSDIQITIGLIGFFGGMIAFGVAAILGAVERLRIEWRRAQ